MLDTHTGQLPQLTPAFSYLFTMQAQLRASLDSGSDGPLGRRVLNAAASGQFAGPRLRGSIAAGGDWMLTRRDNVSHIDARVVLQTDDGAVIHMSYGGRVVVPAELLTEIRDPSRRHLVDPARYYLRTAPTFETGAPAYAWLNDLVCVGLGRLVEGGLAYDVFALG